MTTSINHEHTQHSRTAAETIATLYERALRRYLEASGFDVRDHLTDDELAQYQLAEQIALEQTLGPLRAVGKVVIEVLGGVAEVTSQPDHVEVTIIDHDNAESSAFDRLLENVGVPQAHEDGSGADDSEA